MGYQITFRPPKEFVDTQLKSRAAASDMTSELRNCKLEAMLLCMKPSEKDKAYNYINRMSYLLRMIYNMVRSNKFQEAIDRFNEDGEIWYCGWNYSHDECDWELENVIANQIEDMMILKELVTTPDWFDASEKFYEKLNEVKSGITGFEEICEEIVIYEIMGMLREFDVSDEPDPEEIPVEESIEEHVGESEKPPYYNAAESDPYQVFK